MGQPVSACFKNSAVPPHGHLNASEFQKLFDSPTCIEGAYFHSKQCIV